MRLEQVTISRLRGIPGDWPTLKIAEKGLIVYGPNGVGKSSIIDALEADTPRRRQGGWKTVIAESALFERSERMQFEHAQTVDEQRLVERVVSISFIASAAPDVRADVEERVRGLARSAQQPIRLPYTTELYLGFGRVN